LPNRLRIYVLSAAVLTLALWVPVSCFADSVRPEPVTLSAGWQMQYASKALQAGAAATGAEISAAAFDAGGWYAATVPGTVLTTLVNNHVYPEPLYGENNRPEKIPESLDKESFWYRTSMEVPSSYKGQHVWLNFDGINYASTIWVNGTQVGTTKGAFIGGVFDITANVKPGQKAVLAVLVTPQPHPGISHEHTLRAGIGLNGGESAIDGPTLRGSGRRCFCRRPGRWW
jgi:beta-galactosidase/beta-glucuronidase